MGRLGQHFFAQMKVRAQYRARTERSKRCFESSETKRLKSNLRRFPHVSLRLRCPIRETTALELGVQTSGPPISGPEAPQSQAGRAFQEVDLFSLIRHQLQEKAAASHEAAAFLFWNAGNAPEQGHYASKAQTF